MFQVAKFVSEVYLKAATPLNDIKSFKICGIYPTDQDIFQDADFLAAETADQALISESQASTSNVSISGPPTEDKRPLANTCPLHRSDNAATASGSACPPYSCTSKDSSTSCVVYPQNIHPLPKIQGQRAKIQRKRGTSAILTSSTYKNELAANVTARDIPKLAADIRSKRQGEKRKQL
ncbi:hypothetical protein PR048_002214 [Dryococelus australis]|uniref:Uncharacterized protein n=1 Tax=Dryococelus australis TaxID=614101 RepID=A0ABQ9IJK4_9NEOP|nr:hypothetical protein PR048_002214 [Dryococelus australis]